MGRSPFILLECNAMPKFALVHVNKVTFNAVEEDLPSYITASRYGVSGKTSRLLSLLSRMISFSTRPYNGSCVALAIARHSVTGSPSILTGVSNRDTGRHAEEDILFNAKDLGYCKLDMNNTWALPIELLVCFLEPCKNQRYRGHKCIDLFSAMGRPINSGFTGRFEPVGDASGKNWVPIYWCYPLPESGDGAELGALFQNPELSLVGIVQENNELDPQRNFEPLE